MPPTQIRSIEVSARSSLANGIVFKKHRESAIYVIGIPRRTVIIIIAQIHGPTSFGSSFSFSPVFVFGAALSVSDVSKVAPRKS